MYWKFLGSNIAAILLGGTIIVLAFFMGDATAVVMNLAILVLGFVAGWLIGMLISPYNIAERERFTVLSQAVAVFVSGYFVGKIDKLVEQIFSPDFVLDSLHGFRLIAFLSSFLLSMLVTFIHRTYVRI